MKPTSNRTRPSPSRLGQLLRDLRSQRKLSQGDLASMAGVSRRAIEDIEQGQQQDTSWTVVQMLANALDVSTEELRTLNAPQESGK